MTFVASAPGRCGIIGNPSDVYGGRVLSCSLPARATCRLTLMSEESLPDDTTLWDLAVKHFPVEGPCTVEWSTDIPRSSGLSGSTALLAATVACLLMARGESPDLSSEESRTRFAMLVRDIEREKVVCGYQDALMIVLGGLRSMSFAGKGPVEKGPLPTSEVVDAPLPFLLVTTGVERLSGSVHGPMVERWLAGEEKVVKAMEALPSYADEGTAALRSGDFKRLGELMDLNHSLIAELGGSGKAIDSLIGRCKSRGALGAQLAGAGMGGTVIALTEDADALEAALRADGYSRFLRPAVTEGLVLGA
jgi:galactokinase/mevalonate kinase-like predicted kinase